MEKKYNLIYENTLAVYYRGTDKYRETSVAPFDEFYNKIVKIININKNIKIIIQTDTAQFMDYIIDKKIQNIIIISENKTSYTKNGIHNEQSNNDNYNHIFNFLSIVLIISKCKYIICSSGNCSEWMMFYRGNGMNIMQYSGEIWYDTIF